MSEKLKLFWPKPYWQTEAVDEWLAAQEAAGWRLEGGAFFHRFVFRAAEPKASNWFLTFSDARGQGMYAEGSWLKRHCQADEIYVGMFFPGVFGWADAYRVLTPIDKNSLRELRLSRSRFLRRMAWRSLLTWLTGLAVFGTLTVWGLTTRPPTLTVSSLVCYLIAALSLFWAVYHIIGLCALRRQRRKYERR